MLGRKIKHVGAAAIRFEFALLVEKLTVPNDQDLPHQVVWSRGQQTSQTRFERGKHGHFKFHTPLVLTATMYKDDKSGGFQSKDTKLQVFVEKHKKPKKSGKITINLAEYLNKKLRPVKKDIVVDSGAKLSIEISCRSTLIGDEVSKKVDKRRNSDSLVSLSRGDRDRDRDRDDIVVRMSPESTDQLRRALEQLNDENAQQRKIISALHKNKNNVEQISFAEKKLQQFDQKQHEKYMQMVEQIGDLMNQIENRDEKIEVLEQDKRILIKRLREERLAHRRVKEQITDGEILRRRVKDTEDALKEANKKKQQIQTQFDQLQFEVEMARSQGQTPEQIAEKQSIFEKNQQAIQKLDKKYQKARKEARENMVEKEELEKLRGENGEMQLKLKAEKSLAKDRALTLEQSQQVVRNFEALHDELKQYSEKMSDDAAVFDRIQCDQNQAVRLTLTKIQNLYRMINDDEKDMPVELLPLPSIEQESKRSRQDFRQDLISSFEISLKNIDLLLEPLQKESEQLKSDKTMLQERNTQLKNDISLTSQQLLALRKQQTIYESTIQTVQSKIAQDGDVEELLQQMHEKIEKLREEGPSLEEDLPYADLSHLQAIQQQAAALIKQQQESGLKTELESVKEALNSSTKLTENIQRNLDLLTEEKKAVEQKLKDVDEDYQERLRFTQKELEAAESRIESLVSSFKAVGARHDLPRLESIPEGKDDSQIVVEDHNQKPTLVVLFEKKLIEYETVISNLEGRLQTKDTRMNEHEMTIQELKQIVERDQLIIQSLKSPDGNLDLTTVMRQFADETKASREKISATFEDLIETQKDLQGQRNRVHELEIASLQNTQLLGNIRQKHEDQVNKYREEIQDLRNKISELKFQVSRLENSVEEKTEHNKKLEDSMKTLQKKYEETVSHWSNLKNQQEKLKKQEEELLQQVEKLEQTNSELRESQTMNNNDAAARRFTENSDVHNGTDMDEIDESDEEIYS